MSFMKAMGYLLAICLVMPILALGQHDHHNQHKEDTTKTATKHHKKPQEKHHAGMQHEMDSSKVPMSHSFSLNLPMNRNGSGTGWLPDASPMYGYMLHSKKWMYMVHGNIFIRYNKQDIG